MERLSLVIVETIQVKTSCSFADYVQLVGLMITHSCPQSFDLVLDDIVFVVSLRPFLLQLLCYCVLEVQF